MWHQPCQHCKYTTSVDIQKMRYKYNKLVTHVEEPHVYAVSLLKRVENKRSSINQTVQGSLHRLAQFLMPNTILADKMFLSTAKHTFQSNQPLKASLSFLISFFSFFTFPFCSQSMGTCTISFDETDFQHHMVQCSVFFPVSKLDRQYRQYLLACPLFGINQVLLILMADWV